MNEPSQWHGWETSYGALAILPIEAMLDYRLCAGDIRVLGALSSWRDRKTYIARPTRENLAKRCGMTENGAWRAIRRLERYGWLVHRKGQGGRPRLDGGRTHTRLASYDIQTPSDIRERFQGLSDPELPLSETLAAVTQFCPKKVNRCLAREKRVRKEATTTGNPTP